MNNIPPTTSPLPNSTHLQYSPSQPHFLSATNLSHNPTETNHAFALHTTTNSSYDYPSEKMESNMNKNIIEQPKKVRSDQNNKSDSTVNYNTRNGWGNNPKLQRLVMFYPLAKTHIVFEIHELPLILRRLENGFRTLSLDVQYNQSPISAICISLEQVKISVQFWQSRENSSHGIIEIMKTAGDTIISHHYIRQLLKHASGRCDDDTIHKNDASLSMHACCWGTGAATEGMGMQSTRNIDSLVHQAYVEDERSSRNALFDAMDIASSMLRSDRNDVRQLGLESLVALTDPGKTVAAIANAAAQCILTGTISYNTHDPFEHDDGDNGIDYTNLRDRVLGLALTGRWPEDDVVMRNNNEMMSSNGTGDGRIPFKEVDRELRSRVCVVAWTILTQALNLASSTDVNTFLRGADRHSGVSVGFVHHLLSGMHGLDSSYNGGESSVHKVYFHTACLEVICKHIPAIKSFISLHQVQQVQQYGMLHHAALSRAADHLSKILITTTN